MNRIPLIVMIVASLVTVVCYFGQGANGNWWMELGFVLAAATVISVVISEACDPFSDAAQWVGYQLKLPGSVRGATLDAVASSMPELFTGLFFVVVALSGNKDHASRILDSAEGYGSTIATCAGSSIYNLILIPALCALSVSFYRKQRPEITLEHDVIYRDGVWMVLVQAGLLLFLFQGSLTWMMGVLGILAYAVYVTHLYLATRRFQTEVTAGVRMQDQVGDSAGMVFGVFDVSLNRTSAIVILMVATLVAAMACYFLVELTNYSAQRMGVPPFFVAVILTAAVSSIPDTFLSLNSAARGDDSGAISNVFGSNIFDICVGMSIPLLVGCYLNDWQPIELVGADEQTLDGVVGLRVFLFGLTSVAMGMMWTRRKLTRNTGWLFCGLYGIFIAYAVLGGLGIVDV